MNTDLTRIFGPDGALAQAQPNFRARPQQVELAAAIAEAIAENTQLVAEAGTGTGKTFAYLVLRSSPVARSSSPQAPKRCKTSSSTATCHGCAMR